MYTLHAGGVWLEEDSSTSVCNWKASTSHLRLGNLQDLPGSLHEYKCAHICRDRNQVAGHAADTAPQNLVNHMWMPISQALIVPVLADAVGCCFARP